MSELSQVRPSRGHGTRAIVTIDGEHEDRQRVAHQQERQRLRMGRHHAGDDKAGCPDEHEERRGHTGEQSGRHEGPMRKRTRKTIPNRVSAVGNTHVRGLNRFSSKTLLWLTASFSGSLVLVPCPRHLHPPGELFVETPAPYGGNLLHRHHPLSGARRLGDRQPYRAVGPDILVPVPHSHDGAGESCSEPDRSPMRPTSLILEAWPREVAEPIAGEIHTILTGRRSDVLTLGLVLALYFSSSAVEALRLGLNRAYGVRETRVWWVTRLESIAFVIGGAFVMLVLAVLVVLGPFVWRAVLYWVPALQFLDGLIDFLRIGIATVVIVAGLLIAYKFVPSGRRNWWSILPGVLVTLFLWLLGGLGFGWYLEFYPGAYASTYGGLATAMVALVFLYTLGAIFLFGGELNGTIMLAKRRRRLVEPAPDQIEPPVELPRL